MNSHKNTCLSLLLLSTVALFGQNRNIAKADKEYADYAYVNAIDIYTKVVEKGYESAEIYQKLGNSYYFNARLMEANLWYSKLFSLKNENIDPEYYYRYSQTLKASGDYKKANELLAEFTKRNSSDNRARLYNENKDYLDQISKLDGRYTVEDAGINSEYSDYGGAFYKDKMVFTSTRKGSGFSEKKHAWTNQAFSNLYTATVSEDGVLANPEELNEKINSAFNESTAVYTNDGKTIYFTRNNFIEKKVKTDKNEVVLLKLYKATLVDEEWTNVTELPFNSDEYNCAHPALNADNTVLYFASNMPGTIGQSDIFKVTINSDGTYGKPENLGPEFNTEGRETFPFISKNNEIFFASDGRPGLGGLDVFAVKIKEDRTYSKIFNVGTPVNSSFDDFAYSIDSEKAIGFFASNRAGGKGYDDIYKFKETTPISYDCKQSVKGVFMDEKSNAIIPNAKIILFDANRNTLLETVTDENGGYHFDGLDCEKLYVVRGMSEKYEVVEKSVTTNAVSGGTEMQLQTEMLIKKIEVGTDLAKTFGIELIYFDLDKAVIRKDSEKDLAKILEVLQQYPNIKIEIRSHTDSRQSSAYNLKLSEKRAKSTLKWFADKGIAVDRLTSKGFGESQLLNNCSDGKDCSETDHQKNRRSEFVIIAM